MKKLIRNIKIEIKYIKEEFKFLKAFFSPFKPPKIKVYFGDIAIGVPYFLPRKWVKFTPIMACEALLERMKTDKEYNKNNPDNPKKIKTFKELYEHFKSHKYPKPINFGFSYCGLGWKTKWGDCDYRFEYSPRFSFVFFGKQLVFTVLAEYADHYWESWLYYENNTDKSKSKKERLIQCMLGFPNIWHSYDTITGEKVAINFYNNILRNKYLKLINGKKF